MSEEFNLRNIDRSSWQKFRFDQIAASISERVEPKDTNLDIYVGLEHLDPATVHIKRTGKPSDVDGTKLKFYKGDVIFGRRRAYQRKAGIAEFDGICSAHSLVLRANHQVIDPKLFPFFLHSDLFMHRAIDISVGSLSPTINWGTLKNEEFHLPPKDQQAKLAELLWAGDGVVENQDNLSKSIVNFYQNQLEYHYKKTSRYIQISEISVVNKQSLGAETSSNYNFKYLDIASIIGPKKIGDLQKVEFKNAPSRARRIVNDGDIILALVRPYFKSFVLLEKASDIISSTGTAVLSVKPQFDKYYVFHSFFTKRFMDFCELRMNGTAYPAITAEDVKEFSIPERPIDDQVKISNQLNKIDKTLDNQLEVIKSLKSLQTKLINEIF